MIMTHGHEHAGKNRYLKPSTLFGSQHFYEEGTFARNLDHLHMARRECIRAPAPSYDRTLEVT